MSRAFSAALAAALVLAAAACGGGVHARETGAAAAVPAPARAAAIRARLTKAGYSILEGARLGEASRPKPRGEFDSFGVQADFTSPDSYHLGIVVFGTRHEARAYVAHLRAAARTAARSIACRRQPGCEAYFRSASGARPPVARQVVGATVYTGMVDAPAAHLPLHDFARLVAVASGGAAAG